MAVKRLGIPLVIALLFAATALLAGIVAAAPVYAQNGVCPENPDPVDPADPMVIVDTPADTDQVASPISVSGQAAVFEANVRLTLFDAAGNELVDTFTTAESAPPGLHPFATEIEFTVADTQQGCLRVFEESAVDGSPINVVQVELTLLVDDPDATPEPPDTGSAGLPTDISGGIIVPLAVLLLALTLLISSTLAATMPYQRRRP